MGRDFVSVTRKADSAFGQAAKVPRTFRRAEGKPYVERAALQEADGVLACGSRDTRLSPARRITPLRLRLLMFHSLVPPLIYRTNPNAREALRRSPVEHP